MRPMSRIVFVLLLAFAATTGTAHAGGWATVELGEAPSGLVAGKPWRVELIVKQHPAFSTFRIEDESWGWAQKAAGAPRRYEVTTTTSIAALALRWVKGRRRAMQSRLLRDRT